MSRGQIKFNKGEKKMKLHEQVKAQKKELEIVDDWTNDLIRYLSLPKFQDDTYVNKSDIFSRVNDLKNSRFKISAGV